MNSIRKTVAILLALTTVLSVCPMVAKTDKTTTVKTLKVSATEVSLKSGKTKKIKVKGKYEKIKAKSAETNNADVTVKDKTVKIKAFMEGKTKITVKGYNKKGKLKAKTKITVTIKPIDVAKEYALKTKHKGEATWYDRGKEAGTAGLDDYEGKYYTAALNKEDYLNGLAGAYLEVKDKQGDIVNVLITDMLPSGEKGDIDLSIKAFKKIEPLATGRMKVKWKVIALPTDNPVSFLWNKKSSTSWAQVQVRNSRYPVKKVEYYNAKKKKFIALERESYNYFTAPKGMGSKGPFDLRITDIYGRKIIEKDVKMKLKGKAVKGEYNFSAEV